MRILALMAATAAGFLQQPGPVVRRQNGVAMHSSDPTKVWYAELANAVQNVLTNSPLNEGKKQFVKMLAGPYDEAAVREKLVGLTQKEPVLMLSFVK